MPNTQIIQYLRREVLTYKVIINLSRGRPPREKLPDSGVWRDRYDEMRESLTAAKFPTPYPQPKFTPVALMDLWNKFVSTRQDHPQWAWLVKFCRRWAKVRGDSLPAALRTRGSQSRGGKVRTFDRPFQQVICEIRKDVGGSITRGKIVQWMQERDATSAHPYSFEEDRHLDCYDIYLEGDIVAWKNKKDAPKELRVNSLRPYFNRANRRS